ncbi:MAG TPA: flagellar basal-body rod protein FlgF [Deltaproteobacteria bacterium]|jgi:flagellar basal-body rod protein FlgG|nr:flagellar basal-body rod protein FlgF [Deltaproteobacteria bacterium]OQC23625.1 MAG: Flagellar basal-body rod protein FlgF [Deltaproteobacteria bacterium ADurb.Bin072]HRW79345.1 flagellar basal-body rod protein FlgF [Desulfomonilia bacterium]HNQ84849.1 flagellar basal-body rod protein FlgF [Deltaproteobacteria bacterium]HNS89751.1 flagellar basal-body rod protein FlgF [Deltaproteobacteria bacterium]
MDQGMYTAAAGAIAMEERLTIISNNVANLNTIGFKKDHMSFEQFSKLLDTSMLAEGQYRVIPIDVVALSPTIDVTPGSPVETGNPLDVAMIGDGFFVVSTEDGPRYTRAGSFQLTTDNILVTPQGYRVQGEGGDISIDTTTGNGIIGIDSRGKITYDDTDVDTLQVVRIAPEVLVRKGNNLFDVKEGYVPEPVETPSMSQSYLEAANVEPVSEMVDMIATQRAYDAFQKMIRSINDAYSFSIRNVGTVA